MRRLWTGGSAGRHRRKKKTRSGTSSLPAPRGPNHALDLVPIPITSGNLKGGRVPLPETAITLGKLKISNLLPERLVLITWANPSVRVTTMAGARCQSTVAHGNRSTAAIS